MSQFPFSFGNQEMFSPLDEYLIDTVSEKLDQLDEDLIYLRDCQKKSNTHPFQEQDDDMYQRCARVLDDYNKERSDLPYGYEDSSMDDHGYRLPCNYEDKFNLSYDNEDNSNGSFECNLSCGNEPTSSPKERYIDPRLLTLPIVDRLNLEEGADVKYPMNEPLVESEFSLIGEANFTEAIATTGTIENTGITEAIGSTEPTQAAQPTEALKINPGFPCPHCQKTYLTEAQQKKHLKDVHVERKHMCLFCSRWFKRKDHMIKHQEGGSPCKGANQKS
ncbi:hypothetical protein NCAS_0B04360 [Naumovozyma castellii]|uniref:C2H2-type domain-containing protein n=1 Tax=Naumovozyma castellii TaxID=27288 RepID=G0VAJ5_NAUCA|nr:hypothetical protein NCAS_0B04360 [Naumovozyma castellii CBS 4309]CCC68520.1 hypothetical protein NCAS_0B04360 [Naumovozyma castellii CBS 4309]